MKKRILSAVLISGLTLNAVSSLQVVSATDYDSKIANQENIIDHLTTEQAQAQAKVTAVQKQVDSLQAEQEKLAEENKKLEAESQQLAKDIEVLSGKIVARSKSLENQARSAQKNNTATSYISTLVDSDSLSDAISRIVAIREVVSANERMLEQQKTDKEAIEEKQVKNQEAINTVAENQATLAENANALNTQKAELEVAQLNLAAELATAQDEKNNLLAAKSAAEEKAAQAAAQEAAARAAAQEAVRQQEASVQTAQQVVSTIAPAQPAQPAPAPTPAQPANNTTTTTSTPARTTTPSVNYSGNTYPVGQCTWGVKSLAPWVGNYWGNANQWGASARAAGFSIGSEPIVGSVAVFPYDGGGYGHVAYVTGVQSSTNIQVMEANYAGNQSIGNYRGWFNPTTQAVYYIYPY
ncbi:peptidoglycan hydrolase PcsB [Streptococcus sp. CSL10205-OR2]|uniref:peptidoglycan hydrolase PcsB n=1 Tax=Streptococcus sp. CSL10205-OR2 TaxID=2980558 RepID=UPI0021DA7548|nr:CHAP domain-containing protein [Streptococcus sp. CSL10205-OR2]MCU9534439.1 CHAP domain-containing protein [Streptococcus sp. CSL10205-OR2]